MATHSSVLPWRIPGTGKPGGLPSMGFHRVGHDWSDLAAAAASVLFWTLCVCWFYHFVLHLSDSAFSLSAKQFVVVEHLSCQVPRWVLRGTFAPRAGSHPSSQCTALREEELSVICRFPLARRPSWKTNLWWKDFPLGYVLNGIQH